MSNTINIKPFQWFGSDIERDDGTKHYQLRAYGNMDDGESTCIVINDYKPWLNLVMPEEVTENEADILADSIRLKLTEKLRKDGHQPLTHELSIRIPLYYYRKDGRFCIRLYFDTNDACRHATNLLNKYPIYTGMYGQVKLLPTDTIIDQVKKAHAQLDIRQNDWLKVEASHSDPRVSTLAREYCTSIHTIRQCDDDECSRLGKAKSSYLIFDGEMNSHRKYAFPDALKKRDPVFMWGALHSYWDKERHEQITDEYCLVFHNKLKPEDLPREVMGTKLKRIKYDKYEVEVDETRRVKLLWFDKEIPLCKAFEQLIVDTDPDWVIGHNSNSFDIPYHKTRMARMGVKSRNMSRRRDHVQGYSNIAWSSSAYPDNDFWVPDGEGRIYADTLTMAKRDFKEDSYGLDALCQKYMGIGKHAWGPEDLFRSFREDNPEDLYKTIVYCMQDVWCTWGFFQHMNFDLSYVGMSNIIGIPIFDLYSQGQQRRTQCQMFRACEKHGRYMHSPDREKKRIAGGYVFDQDPGIYEWVLLIDFQGLYPAIMRRFNISNDTYDPDETVPDEDCNILSWDDEHGSWRTRFVKPHIRKGIVPTVLENYTDARNVYKGLMKECAKVGDETGEMLNNVNQLACKVSANSVYGGLAQPGGKLGLEDAGATVTAYGRMLVQKAAKWAISKGFKIVYGDTDSIMITKGESGELWTDYEKENFLEIGQKIVDEMNKDCFTYPILMELDGGFRVMHSVAKKCYTFISYDPNDPYTIDPAKWQSKGLVTSRRDSCLMIRRLYKNVARDLACLRPLEDILELVAQELTRLLRGHLNVEELVTIKKLGSGYKNPNNELAIFQRHLHSLGMNVKPGDRVPHVYVMRENQLKKGHCLEDPVVAVREGLEFHRMQYLKSQFMNKIDKILWTAFPNIIPPKFISEIYKLLRIRKDEDIFMMMVALIEEHSERIQVV